MIEELAAGFARRHGSFTLRFSVPPGKASFTYAMWELTLGKGDDCKRLWGGHDVESLIRFADEELSE